MKFKELAQKYYSQQATTIAGVMLVAELTRLCKNKMMTPAMLAKTKEHTLGWMARWVPAIPMHTIDLRVTADHRGVVSLAFTEKGKEQCC